MIAEVNRPTFASLTLPLSKVCRFIPFEGLREQFETARDFLQFLKPEVLDTVSEETAIEEV